MIVRDEAAFLAECLEHVRHEVDEIIIVDTGSTDQTLTIAQRFTDQIYTFSWTGDFSAARNFALQQAAGDWILSLDADEIIQGEPGSLRMLIRDAGDKEAFLLPLHNPISNSTGEFNTFYVIRIFKNNDLYRYVGKIHEQVSIPDPEKVGLAQSPLIEHKPLPLRVQHKKRNRNLRLLLQASKENPLNPFLQYYLGVEWLMLGKGSYALPLLQKAYRSLGDENLLFRAPALKYLILCLRELGKPDEAFCLCLEASLSYPIYTDIFYFGGILLEEMGEYLAALKWFNHALLCGSPPALFSHLTGSESFLAHYHLGFCYEKLDKKAEAFNAYVTALDTNPKYPYPLYPLILILLSEKGPANCYQILAQKGYLANPILCLTAANLFYLSGHVEEAFLCLDSNRECFLEDKRFLLDLGKYCIYSGRLNMGLNLLRQIPKNSSYFSSAQTLSIIALIFLGNYPEAKLSAIHLWRNPLNRGEAFILLSIIRNIVQDNKGTIQPDLPNIRERETIPMATELYQDYLRYLNHPSSRKSPNHFVQRWGEALETLLKSSENGLSFLLRGYDQRLENLKQNFIKIFGSEWRVNEYVNC